MYVFQIIDWFIVTSVSFVAFCEIVSFVWIYGKLAIYYNLNINIKLHIFILKWHMIIF